MKASEAPIVVAETVSASMEATWKAITEVEQMVQWYFDNIPSFEPKIGFKTEFTVACGGRDFVHFWKITEVDAPNRIVYGWRYDGYSGNSAVTFELSRESEHTTRVKLTHRILEDFQNDVPEFNREACVGGWRYFIQERLKAYLER